MILRGRMLSSTNAPGRSWLTVHLPYCAPRRKQLSSRSLPQVPRTSRPQHLVSRRRAELADRRLAVRSRSFAESRPESAIWLLTPWIGGDGVLCLAAPGNLAGLAPGYDRRQDRGCLARAVRRESVSFAESHRITSAASEVSGLPARLRGRRPGIRRG
jgi:hypothetical protein